MAAARSIAGESESRLLAGERARFAAALAEWEAAQRFNADRPEAQANLGTLYTEQQSWDQAVAAYRRALALDPTYVQASVNLADADRARGDEAARKACCARRSRTTRGRRPPTTHSGSPSSARVTPPGHSLSSGRRPSSIPRSRTLLLSTPWRCTTRAIAAGSMALLRRAITAHPYDRELAQALAAYEGEPAGPGDGGWPPALHYAPRSLLAEDKNMKSVPLAAIVMANLAALRMPLPALASSTGILRSHRGDRAGPQPPQIERKMVMSQALELTPADSQVFWPVYDKYAVELTTGGQPAGQGDHRLRGELRHHDGCGGEAAHRRFLQVPGADAQGPEESLGKFRKVLPEIKVARFLQIESKLDAMVNFAVARQIPLVPQAGASQPFPRPGG